MSIEQNKSVVRRFIEETLDGQNLELVDELLSPDYVNHLAPGGREGFKQFNIGMRSALPDLKIRMNIEYMIAEGDHVVVRITFHLTNGDKEATGSDLSEYRLANGKIVEDWPPVGMAFLFQQVGVPLPTAPGNN